MKKLNADKIERFGLLIKESENILITTHVNADGDAIGASLGLALVLAKLGKKVNVITPNDFPEFLKWMAGIGMIHIYDIEQKFCDELSDNADLIIAVDFNDPKRLRRASSIFTSAKVPKVLIDHHPDPVNFVDISFSETSLGSASELLFHLLQALDLAKYLDREVAEAIFTGIMTDTGCFSYSCSYPGIWEIVSRLMKEGIDRDKIYQNIYSGYSENRMRLMGYCLNEKMVILKKYNTAYIALDACELTRFKHEQGDTESFVNLPFSIKGIRLTALFMEQDNHVKISLRSRGDFSVHQFASRHFGGGGHQNAAGAEWDLPIDKTVEMFTALLSQYEDNLQ